MEQFQTTEVELSEAVGREVFVSTSVERVAAPVSLVIGWVYVKAWCETFVSGYLSYSWMLAFAALLCLGAMLAFRDVRTTREHWVWLGCLWTALLCGAVGRARAWGDWVWLMAHGFGAWWLIVRSGRLIGSGTGTYCTVDLVHGLLLVPFGNFLLRLRVIKDAVTRRRNGQLPDLRTALAALGAGLAALCLLSFACALLSDADPNFARLAGGLATRFNLLDSDVPLELALSLPVGAYLYGLVFGLQREPETAAEDRRAKIDAGVAALRRVPPRLWPALMGLFVAVYLAFFALQGSYLFDGLRGLLPEPFTAAEYARRGFFELCGVMAVNFALLGTASLSARGGLRGSGPSLALSAVLIGQTALFSVTAGAKLILYIRRFGFTPLRIRSAWLVLILLAACLASLRHLLTGRDSVKHWLIFAAVTLAGTCMW